MNNKTERTRKPLKKTALKSIIALVLCMATIIGSIGAGANTASAAGKTPTLKVQFKGKTVDLLSSKIKQSNVKKKWGKPSEEGTRPAEDEHKKWKESYKRWEKGKTSIFIVGKKSTDRISSYTVDIYDKNASVFGVKVGMKKAQAIKKIKKVSGLKIDSSKNSLSIYTGKDKYSFYGYPPINIELRNNKVSNIYACSVFW